MTDSNHRVAVVIPAYNAGQKLGQVLEGTQAYVDVSDIWVVDDGSTDNTATVAREHGVRLILQKPNQGKASALRRGFKSVRGYDLIITMDADGQHDPRDLPRFLEASDRGDLIVGARALAGRMPWHRRIGNHIASWITTALAGQAVPDSQSGYRMHTRELIDSVVSTIPNESSGYLFETEILVRAARQGFRLSAVSIPTVYEDEQSHFRPTREVPLFLGLFSRLAWELVTGQFKRRKKPTADSQSRLEEE